MLIVRQQNVICSSQYSIKRSAGGDWGKGVAVLKIPLKCPDFKQT